MNLLGQLLKGSWKNIPNLKKKERRVPAMSFSGQSAWWLGVTSSHTAPNSYNRNESQHAKFLRKKKGQLLLLATCWLYLLRSVYLQWDERKNIKKELQYFRPPGGAYDNRIIQIAALRGYRHILWNVSGDAGRFTGDNLIVWYLVRQIDRIKPTPWGSILLMHFRPTTLAVLPSIIEGLRKERGIEPVSLSQVFSQDDGQIYRLQGQMLRKAAWSQNIRGIGEDRR